jgi:hypothetical protein
MQITSPSLVSALEYINNLEPYIVLGECASAVLNVAQPIKVLGDKLAACKLVLLFLKITSKDGKEYRSCTLSK